MRHIIGQAKNHVAAVRRIRISAHCVCRDGQSLIDVSREGTKPAFGAHVVIVVRIKVERLVDLGVGLVVLVPEKIGAGKSIERQIIIRIQGYGFLRQFVEAVVGCLDIFRPRRMALGRVTHGEAGIGRRTIRI